MSDMTKAETIERFVEGLKQAASAARGLASLKTKKDWEKVAMLLERLRSQGMNLSTAGGMTRQETLLRLDKREEELKAIH